MAPRKKEEVTISQSSQATVDEMATTIWGSLFTPDEKDAEKNAASYKSATDKLQKLFEALRNRRDNSKPVQRERRDTEQVLAESKGKPLAELQASYVHIEIGKTKGGEPMLERVSLPRLRTYSETEGHPMHQAALDFLKANKVRFIEREGASRGKKAAYFEAVTTGKAAEKAA